LWYGVYKIEEINEGANGHAERGNGRGLTGLKKGLKLGQHQTKIKGGFGGRLV
jgi:hypothetical protein